MHGEDDIRSNRQGFLGQKERPYGKFSLMLYPPKVMISLSGIFSDVEYVFLLETNYTAQNKEKQ